MGLHGTSAKLSGKAIVEKQKLADNFNPITTPDQEYFQLLINNSNRDKIVSNRMMVTSFAKSVLPLTHYYMIRKGNIMTPSYQNKHKWVIDYLETLRSDLKVGKLFKINILNNKAKEPGVIYCGRGSALGNYVFPMSNESQRDQACDAYDKWFPKHVKDPDIKKVLLQIWCQGLQVGEVSLSCFCAPKRCHTETIKAYLETLMHKYLQL